MGLGRIADAGVYAPILPQGEIQNKDIFAGREWGPFSKGQWIIIHGSEPFHLESHIGSSFATIADPWYPAGVYHMIVDEDNVNVSMKSFVAGALGWIRLGYTRDQLSGSPFSSGFSSGFGV